MVAPAWAPRCQEKGVGLDVREDQVSTATWSTAGAGAPGSEANHCPTAPPPSGPGGPQLPHCHPCLSVTRRPPCTGGDGGWTETQAEVLASRQLYWFSVCAFLSRGPAQRLPRVQLPHQINQHAIAQRGVEQHQLAPREGVYQPRRPLEVPAGSAVPAAAQRQGELQDFQDSCGRNEHGIRAQYWGPAIYIQPACTLSKRTLQGLCYAPYCTWTWTFELSDDSMSRFPSQKLVWRN
ncbi:uncharacterized protein LOC120621567 [Pteropus medius]|uniref:uncharacterized protein LOC120621567 n=1 Tax=Pteropus vampyrus TaxID=132908 RepID=UPI00196B4847|nr:uncharacterized protein LOC120621567 [Pteropus giganteus]